VITRLVGISSQVRLNASRAIPVRNLLFRVMKVGKIEIETLNVISEIWNKESLVGMR
jgi:hypothetical protein